MLALAILAEYKQLDMILTQVARATFLPFRAGHCRYRTGVNCAYEMIATKVVALGHEETLLSKAKPQEYLFDAQQRHSRGNNDLYAEGRYRSS